MLTRSVVVVVLALLVLQLPLAAQELDIAEFEARRAELREKYKNATSPAEKRAVVEELRQLQLKQAEDTDPLGDPPTAEDFARWIEPLGVSGALGLGAVLGGDGKLNIRDIEKIIDLAAAGGLTDEEKAELRELRRVFADLLSRSARRKLKKLLGPPESDPPVGGDDRPTEPAAPTVDLAIDSNNDGTIDETDDGVEDSESRRLIVNDDDDGAKNGPDHADETIDGGSDRGDLGRMTLDLGRASEGATVTLEVSPAGIVRVFGADGKVVVGLGATSGPVEATGGKVEFLVEGAAEGEVVLTARVARDGAEATDSVRARVEAEKVYLFLFGYQGSEESYLDADIRKLSSIVKALERVGYKVYDEGSSFDQSKIDAAFSEENVKKHPKIVIIDRSASRSDLLGYLDRGTIRGVFWGSHGYMEPFVGCTDEELLTLESRIWSCPQGVPADTDQRNFVREVKERLARQSQLPLDFIIMHSCATGGLGTDYWDEPWHYTHPDTKRRVEKKYNRFPPAEELKQRTFDELGPYAGYLVTYAGSAYFGMHDVNKSLVVKSISETGRR